MAKIDLAEVKAPTSSEDVYEYVTIPERDLFDMPHPNIQINETRYGPGKHYVAKQVADVLKDRLQQYEMSNVRLMRPVRDHKAEQLMQRGYSPNSAAQTTNF